MNLTEWKERGWQLRAHGNSNMWEIADWLLAGERVGADSKYKDAAKILSFSVGTCRNYASCARKFPVGVRNVTPSVTFKHHLVIKDLDLQDENKIGSLKAAQVNGWSAAKLRAETLKRMEQAGIALPVKTTKPKRNIAIDDAVYEFLGPALSLEIGARAEKAGKERHTYLLDLVAAHVAPGAQADAEMHRAAFIENELTEQVARLKRFTLLSSTPLTTNTWEKRTLERCSRLYTVARPRSLQHFVDLFRSIWGDDLLPLNWLLEQPCGARNPVPQFWPLQAKDFPRRDPELEKAAILNIEEERRLSNVHEPPPQSAVREAFPDDEPLFYVAEHKERLRGAVAANKRAAKVANDAVVYKRRAALLDAIKQRPRSATLLGGYKRHIIKRDLAALVKAGELVLRDDIYSTPAPEHEATPPLKVNDGRAQAS